MSVTTDYQYLSYQSPLTVTVSRVSHHSLSLPLVSVATDCHCLSCQSPLTVTVSSVTAHAPVAVTTCPCRLFLSWVSRDVVMAGGVKARPSDGYWRCAGSTPPFTEQDVPWWLDAPQNAQSHEMVYKGGLCDMHLLMATL